MTRTGAVTIAEARAGKAGPRGRIQRSAPERRTYNGRVYASLAEESYARELNMLVGAGRIRGWEPQLSFPLFAACQMTGAQLGVATYRADFRVTLADGSSEIHEVKARGGYRDPVWKLKHKWFMACYPQAVIRVVER